LLITRTSFLWTCICIGAVPTHFFFVLIIVFVSVVSVVVVVVVVVVVIVVVVVVVVSSSSTTSTALLRCMIHLCFCQLMSPAIKLVSTGVRGKNASLVQHSQMIYHVCKDHVGIFVASCFFYSSFFSPIYLFIFCVCVGDYLPRSELM